MITPQYVLAQIPLLATHPFLSIDQLEGGNSNQSYLISTPEIKYVLRLDGEAQKIFQCSREFELELLKLASAKQLAPKPIYSDFENGVLLYTFLEGEELTLEQLSDPLIKQQFSSLISNISLIGKQLKLTHPKQAFLNRIILESDLPEYEQLLQYQASVKSICLKLESLPEEFCLCHNDISPSNLLINSESKLFVLDWEYAGSNHPLLDFAFFANNYDLNESWLQQHYPENSSHPSVSFSDVRRLAWFIEAIWYAKRQLHNPSDKWVKLMQQALIKL